MSGGEPLVSFVVLSYNYRHYIGQTIDSILSQTVQDFEIVVIDDGSSDGSVDFLRSLADPRIVVIENETNLGGSASFNRAFAASRGRFIANVDSDDWIAPNRTALQLRLFEARPDVDIVGTHVRFMDAKGQGHPRAFELEPYLNHDWAPNKPESWVVENRLCRSSTMVRRRFHETYGLYDPDMVYAPDFEVWTRALRHGRRFALVEEPLTFYRLHDKGVTHANARGTLVEIAYLMGRNLIPLAHEVGVPTVVSRIKDWLWQHPSFPVLTARERLALLALVLAKAPMERFKDFHDLLNGPPQPDLEAAGANLLALCDAANTTPLLIQLHKDLSALVESRDWWHGKANEYLELLSDLSKSAEAAKTALKGRIKSIEYTGESSRRSDDAAVIDQLTSALKRSKKLLSDGRGNQVTRVARYVKDHPYARHPFLRPLRRGVIWAIRRLGRI